MELSLHIGTEKTGTSTIQRFLAINRQALAKAGVLVPRSLGETNHRILPAIVNNDEFIDDFIRNTGLLHLAERRAKKAHWRAAFIGELSKSDANYCVISSEHLQSRLKTPEELERLSAFLRDLFERIRIILYIRRPIETAVSLYSTAVKYGALHPDVPPPDNPYFRDVVHHAKTIRMWRTAFPQATLCPRLFDKDAFFNGDLLDDFMDACQLPEFPYQRPAIQNESLSILGIELLRRINQKIPVTMNDGHPNPLRKGLVPFFEKYFSSGARLLPSAKMAEWYDQEFAASDEWVRQNFFADRPFLFRPATVRDEPSQDFDPVAIDSLTGALVELWQARKDRRI